MYGYIFLITFVKNLNPGTWARTAQNNKLNLNILTESVVRAITTSLSPSTGLIPHSAKSTADWCFTKQAEELIYDRYVPPVHLYSINSQNSFLVAHLTLLQTRPTVLNLPQTHSSKILFFLLFLILKEKPLN